MPGALKLALAAAVCVVVGAGCGGAGFHPHAAIAIQLKVTDYQFRKGKQPSPRTSSYTLTCLPSGGTLPYAARVCADIVRHPQPMLHPHSARTVCSGTPFMAQVAVTATANGSTSTFTGAPDCDWPGSVGLAVYYDAATRHARWLAPTERRLRCDDDLALLAKPTPWVSVFACTHNLWTPRTAMLIRIAKHAPVIHSLGDGLFPDQVGDRRCTIPHGGPAPGGHFAGVCEVTVKKVWSTPTVTFTESWRIGSRSWRSTVRLILKGKKVVHVAYLGVGPPQMWS